ncbi:phosphatase PAP2 family protein [Sulfuricurvum sp.]|uniref:phosphatase PAP2 family protein n=1 Tax=Sulfuricurvum sp. TaxID=2025608 RepID=UPI003BB7FD11
MKIIITFLSLASLLFGDGFDSVPKSNRDSGIFVAQDILPYALMGISGIVALNETNATLLGKTAWKAMDAGMIAAISAEVLKPVFGRKRPEQTVSSNDWFKEGDSFPSGHTAVATAVVIPFMIEYGEKYPWVYSAALIPIYEAVGRVKARQHWPTDTIGGVALGAICGYVASIQEKPIVISIIPYGDGIYTGISYKF